MSRNPVAKHMNRINRPATHKNGNKGSQEPLDTLDGVYCQNCGSLDLDESQLENVCKTCSEGGCEDD